MVRAPSGEISIDLVGKKPGRGAYLCPDPACLAKAKKKKALERCFEQPVPAEVYDALAGRDLLLCHPISLLRHGAAAYSAVSSVLVSSALGSSSP